MSRNKSLPSPGPAIPPELLDSLVTGPVTAEGFAELVLSFKGLDGASAGWGADPPSGVRSG